MHIPVLLVLQDPVTVLREAYVATPGLLQFGMCCCVCAPQHLWALHTSIGSSSCCSQGAAYGPHSIHGAVGLVAIIIVHVEQLEKPVSACLAEPTLKKKVEGHRLVFFSPTGQTAVFQTTCMCWQYPKPFALNSGPLLLILCHCSNLS